MAELTTSVLARHNLTYRLIYIGANAVILELSGDFRFSSRHDLWQELDTLALGSAIHVLICLKNVKIIDTGSLLTILRNVHKFQAMGGTLTMGLASEAILKIVRDLGVHHQIRICTDTQTWMKFHVPQRQRNSTGSVP
jgi:anti-anti-sigma regulatory factor